MLQTNFPNFFVSTGATATSQANMEYLKNIGEGVAAMLSPLGESLLGFITNILVLTPHPDAALIGLLANNASSLAGIDVDIDVEHEGKRTKVTPTPSASSGPPSAPSDSGSVGLLSRGSGPGSQVTEESISEGAKVIMINKIVIFGVLQAKKGIRSSPHILLTFSLSILAPKGAERPRQ